MGVLDPCVLDPCRHWEDGRHWEEGRHWASKDSESPKNKGKTAKNRIYSVIAYETR